MIVTIPIRTVSELNVREHWRMRHKRRKHQRQTAWAHTFVAVGESGLTLEHLLPCAVTLTRIAPRKLDAHDGLPASMKAIVDGIADALGIDDGSDQVTWSYEQRRGKAKEYAVEVRIERRSNASEQD